MQQYLTMQQEIKGKAVSWKTVHGISTGTIIGQITRKKDNEFLGYLVELENGKRSIVHPKSFINASQTTK